MGKIQNFLQPWWLEFSRFSVVKAGKLYIFHAQKAGKQCIFAKKSWISEIS